MQSEQISERIGSLMDEKGYRYKTLSVTHLPEAESDLKFFHAQGILKEGFLRERLAQVRYDPANLMEDAQTLFIVAVPQPTVIVFFTLNGLEHPVVIPPTYDQTTDKAIETGMNSIMQPYGYHACMAPAPWKYLAVRSGLAVYGKNNIVYIPGNGSFHRLVSFITNWPCPEDHWNLPMMMDRCNRCRACIVFCPTKAIDEHRFIIHAERCITFHNELTCDLPDFIDPSWHHCLLGCMRCQECCPENKVTRKIRVERERFSEQETSMILQRTPLEELPAATRRKLEHLSLAEDYALIPRNLGLLL